jgi:protein-disulfide isomerase/uncharacterized membrane protein
MRTSTLTLLFRFALVTALFACAALFVDYQNAGDPAFCGVGSGCMALRLSPYSSVFGLPLPWVGLGAFASLFTASLFVREKEIHGYVIVLTAGGALFACALIYIQAFVLRTFCKWCVIVDTSAIVAALAGGLVQLRLSRGVKGTAEALERATSRPVRVPWGMAGTAAVALPIVWGMYPVVPPPPADIAAMQANGAVTIVSFTDFQCPFCRKLHPDMKAVRAQLGDRCHFTRKMMPLEGHPGAMPAALAYCCMPEDKQEAMAEALYAVSTDQLTRDGTVAIARGLGADENEMRACLDAPATKAKIDADVAMFERLNARALPLTYVGDRVVMGYNPDRLRKMAASAGSTRAALPLWAMFAAMIAALAGAIALTWKRVTSAI